MRVVSLGIVGLLFCALGQVSAESPVLKPVNLRCQGFVDPLGIDAKKPALSWIVASEDPSVRGQMQSAYQVMVADEGSNEILWDSGKVEGSNSIHIPYNGKPLRSHRRYVWKVRVWNREDQVSEWSGPQSWSTGFLEEGWPPEWIGGTGRTQRLRKEFALPKPVKRAWVYASALGLYELRLNGRKVGDDWYAPGWTDYRTRVQYQCHDVTGLLQKGRNAIGAELAPGWYMGRIAWFAKDMYGKEVAFAARLHVEFEDGTQQVVGTDKTWQAGTSPVTDSDMQDGDRYDARLEQPGWDAPNFNDAAWKPVSIVKLKKEPVLVAQAEPSIGVLAEVAPVKVGEPKPGLFVYDLGENITGVVRIKAKGAAGTTLTLQHAERLNADGTLDLTNLKLAKATDVHILKGQGEEVFQPKFTFHGFRYFSVQGPAKAPALADVTGLVTGNRVEQAGTLNTYEDDLNRVLENIHRTLRNSFLSVPMDSSQRSERLGWTGDANVMAATSAYMFDAWRFFAKWQTDILDAQSLNDGGKDEGYMPNVAPKWKSPGKGHAGSGGGWGDVGVNLPYVLWLRYGDTKIIEESYVRMQKWLVFLESKLEEGIVPNSAQIARAGDWENVDDDTFKDVVATAYYALDLMQMAEMAEAIGKTTDAAHYREQYQKVRAAFIGKWVSGNGLVAKGSQTAQVFALYIGLYPDGKKEAVLEKLVENIEAHGNHLTTGYLGTQWLLHVLADNGRLDVAYAILQQTTQPSWIFMTSMEQTTLWESWDTLGSDGNFLNEKRTSLGHSALGSAGDWMFQAIGGLVPDSKHPGFHHFYICPRPGGTLKQAEMGYPSPYGKIATRWIIKGNKMVLEVEVPVNATATIMLPAMQADRITEGGKPAAASPGVAFLESKEGTTRYKVGSGTYSFMLPFGARK